MLVRLQNLPVPQLVEKSVRGMNRKFHKRNNCLAIQHLYFPLILKEHYTNISLGHHSWIMVRVYFSKNVNNHWFLSLQLFMGVYHISYVIIHIIHNSKFNILRWKTWNYLIYFHGNHGNISFISKIFNLVSFLKIYLKFTSKM